MDLPMNKRAPQHKKVSFFRFCAMLLHCFPAVLVIVISDSTKERSRPTPFYFVALGIPLRVRVEMENGRDERTPRPKRREESTGVRSVTRGSTGASC